MKFNVLTFSLTCLMGLAACQEVIGTPNHGTTPTSTDPNQTYCDSASVCDGKCVDLKVDPANCGSCGSACSDGELCKAGKCAVAGCAHGVTQCEDACVDLQDDPANCGSCGKACGASEVCSKGVCAGNCGNGSVKCGNLCVDLQNDVANCGGCGTACAAGEVCVKGTCGSVCGRGTTQCGDACADVNVDPNNCGFCGNACDSGDGEVCVQGSCQSSCGPGTLTCDGLFCSDLNVDPYNCGFCGVVCDTGEVCQGGVCETVCGGGTVKCDNTCVDLVSDMANCGSCGTVCTGNKTCTSGVCTTLQCPTGDNWCANGCVNLKSDVNNCGACGTVCATGKICKSGACATCDSAVSDCDGDGWLVSEGDCCDKPGACGSQPELVNPGAIEVVGNGVDDNCNGKTDLFDTADTIACDTGLTGNSTTATDYAKAMGICRTTVANPATKQDKTWGLIDAQLLRADGTPISDPTSLQSAIRTSFGASIKPLEGASFVVLSNGLAADATQTNPGPNGGAPGGDDVDNDMGSSVDISACSSPLCIEDWFNASNPPLKLPQQLPVAPNCGSGSDSASFANDSVMLVLTLRAPTNARAFSFNSFFFSAEYPEFVCSTYNDQYIALVDTPAGTPQPIANPIDKNLMTYGSGGEKWPIGINVAGGTNLFSVCRPNGGATDSCWQSDVSPQSCQLGESLLAGTGFETPQSGTCDIGGGTFWLTTAGNVIPGEIVQIRMAIWDVGDEALDSTVLIDGFQWLSNATLPGTN